MGNPFERPPISPGEPIHDEDSEFSKENPDELTFSDQDVSQKTPDSHKEISEGNIKDMVEALDKMEQSIEKGLPPEKAKIVSNHWKGFMTALLMTVSSAGAIESNPVFSQEGKKREQTIEAKEKLAESRQLDVALLYLHTSNFNINGYNFLPIPKGKELNETKYSNPLARAYREAYEKNLKNKDKYRMALAQLQTAELTVLQGLGKEINRSSYDFGPVDVNASESPQRAGGQIYDDVFGEKNKNPNRRLILVASVECKPPLGDSKKRLGGWDQIPAIDVVLVSTPGLRKLEKKNEDLWNEFCGKNGSLTVVTPTTKETETANADTILKERTLMRREIAVKLYETLSEKLKPRDQQK